MDLTRIMLSTPSACIVFQCEFWSSQMVGCFVHLEKVLPRAECAKPVLAPLKFQFPVGLCEIVDKVLHQFQHFL